MSSLISAFLKTVFKEFYRGPVAMGLEMISVVVSLSIYYFTSLAFASGFENKILIQGMNYFSFMVLAELAFLVPFFLIEGAVRTQQKAFIDGTIYTIENLTGSFFKSVFFHINLAFVPLILRFLAILCIFVWMESSLILGVRVLLCSFMSILIFIPFLFLGLSLFLVSGRGASILAYFCSFLMIFSGGYFPISVFPDSLEKIILNINFFEAYLQLYREVSWGMTFNLDLFLKFFLPSITLLPISLVVLKFARKKYLANGGLRVFLGR